MSTTKAKTGHKPVILKGVLPLPTLDAIQATHTPVSKEWLARVDQALRQAAALTERLSQPDIQAGKLTQHMRDELRDSLKALKGLER